MSYNCCFAQDPPSPDALLLRPVKLLEGALQATSESTVSPMSKPEDVTELQPLFEDDNQDAVEDESRAVTVKKSFNTLDAIKSKLRKHLSRESAPPKRPPRSTVGTSDDEILRRKELRLIRERRIKEELSSEMAYDDDAKSMRTLATGDSPYKKPWLTGHSKDNGCLEPARMSLATPLLMRRSYDGLDVWRSSSFPRLRRRHSLAVLDNFTSSARTCTDSATGRCGSDVSMPRAPLLKPQILPSIVDSATRRTSWRLSFSSDQRASQLRNLSQEHEPSLSATPPGTRDTFSSPLKWFRGEGVHLSPFASTNISNVLHVSGDTQSQKIFCPNIDDCEGVDGNAEMSPAPISLMEMRISQRLASQGLNSHSSSPELSSWGSQSHYPSRSHNSETSSRKAQLICRQRHSASSSCKSNQKSPHTWGDVLRDDISSICASGENRANHTSELSKLSIFPLLTPNERTVSLLNSESKDERTAPQAIPIVSSRPSPTDARASTDGHHAILSRHDCQSLTDDYILLSETLKSREREVGLQNSSLNFPKSISSQTSSFGGKFNEDFDEQDLPQLTSPKKKSSLYSALRLPRLAKLVVRSYDGESPFELQVPGRQGFGYNFSNRSHSSAGMISPGARSPIAKVPVSPIKDPLHDQGDEAVGVWSHALKRTLDEYESQLEAGRASVERETDNSPGNFLDIRTLPWKLKEKGKPSVVALKDMDMAKPLVVDIKNNSKLKSYLEACNAEKEAAEADEWAEELAARERQAKAKTAAVGQTPPSVGMRKSPESWARFPSHTREERNASAGVSDHVVAKDFAIKDMKNGVIEWMTSGRKYHRHHHKKEQHHSLPTKVSRQIRTSLYKLQAIKDTAASDVVHGRRSSIRIGGKLEYPELEILAGEIAGEGLYEEIEQEIEEQMRNDERATRKVVFGGEVDGEVDNEGKVNLLALAEASEISIADPRFYDDCITMPLEDDDKNEGSRLN